MCLFTSTMFAQVYTSKAGQEYLTVKGLELKPGLTMYETLKHFLAKGFKKSEDFDLFKDKLNVYILEGSFFNFSNCTINIIPTSNDKNIVRMITIEFPERESFKSLKEEYDNLKLSLSDKYYLYECTEKFDNDYVEKSSSDFLKLHAIEKDEAEFKSRFILTNEVLSALNGYITMYISCFNRKNRITLTYSTPDSVTEQRQKSDDL